MEESHLLKHPGVKKKIVHGGQGPLPHFPSGTKLVFHFQTLLSNSERTVIDDSRKNKHPTEIFVGKMFKMEVWEVLLTSMRLGEVAEFWCDAIVGEPLSYERESWLMEKDEKMQAAPSLHLQGNALVRQGRYAQAAEKYREAVLLLRTVQSRVRPWGLAGEILVTPLVLNYCQCKLELGEYYEVIEHTSELIDKHKGCVKAYYKRAKAYAAVWSEREARRDLLTVAELDGTLARLVQKELRLLSERMREKYRDDRERYRNILEERTTGEEEEDEGGDPNELSQCPRQEAKSLPAREEGQRDVLQAAAVTEEHHSCPERYSEAIYVPVE
uniref:AIP/AIPL N-terminal FKBP-type PPIase domain-containing protein n=1 Tax=Electrophorus electricus TaxID=8005 RepID=A0A4W4H3A6_ELEEL